MASSIPITSELIAAAFKLLALKAEHEAAWTEPVEPVDRGSEYALCRRQTFTAHLWDEVMSARYVLAQSLAKTMQSVNHGGFWSHLVLLEEFIGEQWILIGLDQGKCVYTSPDIWAQILATDTRLDSRERRMRVATNEDWLTLEACLPMLLDLVTGSEILARSNAARTTVDRALEQLQA